MDKTLQIRIGSKREILVLAYRELSDVAGRAAADGKSLYDAVIPHSGDVDRMCGMVDEAVKALVERLYMILDEEDRKPGSTFSTEAEGILTRIFVNTPDLPGAGNIAAAIRDYLASYVTAQMMRERNGQHAEDFGAICQSKLALAVAALMRRKQPERRC